MSGSDEKDRFGDKLREAERAREEQYFKKRDEELINKLREQKEEEKSEAKTGAAGLGRCPKCGVQLQRRAQHRVEVEECPSCGGVWLDRGELEEIARRDSDGWLSRLLGSRDR